MGRPTSRLAAGDELAVSLADRAGLTAATGHGAASVGGSRLRRVRSSVHG